jgi:hypothetical protein
MSTQDPNEHTMRQGVTKKRPGETYGQYLGRITAAEEYGISMAARVIGVTPRSIFESYIPIEADSPESPSAEQES